MANKCPKCQTDNPDTLKFCGECGTHLLSPKEVDVTETIEAPREELTTGSTFARRKQIIEEKGPKVTAIERYIGLINRLPDLDESGY